MVMGDCIFVYTNSFSIPFFFALYFFHRKISLEQSDNYLTKRVVTIK
jgi:hypothetical protein